MKGLPSKILPAQFNCIGLRPNDYYDVDKTNDSNKFLIQPPGINPKVVSSVYGKIKTLVMFYATGKDDYGKNAYCYFGFLKELMQKLNGGGRTFIIVTEDSGSNSSLTEVECNALEVIASNNGNRLCHVRIKKGTKSLDAWAQDAFLAVEYEMGKDKKTYLLEALKAKNKGVVIQVVDFLKKSNVSSSNNRSCKDCKDLKFEHVYSNISFVGGNVLAGNDFVLIGLNESHLNIKHKGKKWLNKSIILLHSNPTLLYNEWTLSYKDIDGDDFSNQFDLDAKCQGIFHLDVFITLAGKNEHGEEVFVIGEPVVGFPIDKNLNPGLKKLIQLIISETTKAIDEMIVKLKEGLVNKPYKIKIIRNPLPLTYYESENTKSRYWTWASYNNCLVEHYTDSNGDMIKQVFLPSYGISSDYSGTEKNYGSWTELHKYDLHNKCIWENLLDYKCELLQHDYNQFMRKQGALNCLTNCIERGPNPSGI